MAKHLETFRRPDGDPSKVTLQIAQHALWLMGDKDNGLEPGDFTTKLWATMVSADRINLARLALAFPGYGEAFDSGMRSLWGFEWMRTAVMDAQAAHV